ncbi:hypothetical protein GCM10010218_40040 [Streptomyces mashuensis]|uniref:Uncharacterized protein n=1 Tax=Streptomyces mashuensis TaxID=33904 RepID=A0A919B5J6_9ACTN|nr:hypothetical protein [Streptomyces mashuensis]GHF54752.1 hypothetical protein GCM10010218_40040 [Streptomyces mashuensis]
MPLDDHDHDDAFARRLSAALENAAHACPPPSTDLVGRATERGRRMRRARAFQVGAGCTALTLVALGGTLLGTGGAGDATAPRDVPPAASGPARPATAPVISGEEMAAILKSLMPKDGTVSDASGTGSAGAGDKNRTALTAKLTYTDTHGTTGVDIAVRRLEPGDRPGGCLPVEVRPYDTCEAHTLPDGSTLYTTKSYTHPNADTGQRRWYAELATADDAVLFLQEFGGGGEKASGSGAAPALSVEQLGEIVRSPAWRKAVAALPAPASGTPTAPGRRGADDQRPAAVLMSLLPPGGRITDRNADAGLVQLVYDDGHGKSMIEADVQTGMTDALSGLMDCPPDSGSSHCRSETLPDGTRVKVTQAPSEKGGSAVVRAADTLRPDGRRVLVREINSYAESGPVTRPEPPLSPDRLRTMALDPKWFG